MATETPFGPGTVKVGETGTELSIECEVTGGAITHEYTVTEVKRKLCGTVPADRRTRADGVKLDFENDLTAEGVYAMLAALPESPDPQPIVYTPNTEVGASWAGTIVPLLPSEIGADEYGKPLASSVEWPAVGLIVFTPGTAPAAAPAGGVQVL